MTSMYQKTNWYDGQGKPHRFDGPAVISSHTEFEPLPKTRVQEDWFIHGKRVFVADVRKWMKENGVSSYPFDKDLATLFQLRFG